ncbi:hypothetical protein FQZ97_768430 [compost metagenome]
MLVVLVAGHQVDQGVAALLQGGVVVERRVPYLRVEAALPVHAAAHGELVKLAGQAVGGEQLGHMLGLGGG